MFVPRDTTPEAWRVQIEIWRRMTPEQRSRIAAELSENVRNMAFAAVRSHRPDLSEEEIRLVVYERMYGKELVEAAWRRRGEPTV